MKNILLAVQILSSVSLIALVLLQSKGVGLGSSFSGRSSQFSTKRGMEKAVFGLTIIVSAIFIISSIIQTIVF